MNYKTHNDAPINIDGTHLQGYVTANYADLCSLFGAPTESDGLKVDAEWQVQFTDGVVATIYNWKDGPNYMGKHGTPVHLITHWHVGGTSKHPVARIEQLVASVERCKRAGVPVGWSMIEGGVA